MKKTIVLLTRKPGTTLEQFRHHYETAHAPGAIERIPALARADYRRNFIESSPSDTLPRPDFDVITEITFADETDYEAFRRSLEDPAVWRGSRRMRRGSPTRRSTRSYTVTEHRSA